MLKPNKKGEHRFECCSSSSDWKRKKKNQTSTWLVHEIMRNGEHCFECCLSPLTQLSSISSSRSVGSTEESEGC